MRHRSFLRLTVIGFLTIVLVGCSGDQPQHEALPEPVSQASPTKCDVCGMVIENHHGPNGQIFYRPEGPEEDTGPVHFDSLKQGLLPYFFESKKRDREVRAIYVTDYSKVNYTIETVKGDPYIQTAVKPETFSPVQNVVFVVESDVRGAMGKDFIPFSDREDAQQFVDAYGGELLTFQNITTNRTEK